MKLNTLNREFDEMIEKIDLIKQKECVQYIDKISLLNCQIKDIEKEIQLFNLNKVLTLIQLNKFKNISVKNYII